jgi:hypothetical protein
MYRATEIPNALAVNITGNCRQDNRVTVTIYEQFLICVGPEITVTFYKLIQKKYHCSKSELKQPVHLIKEFV